MLRIYSPTGSEGALVDFLVKWANKNGFKAYKDDVGNLIAEKGANYREKEILLVGHVDTVPGMPPVRMEGKRLYGRGAVDAKAPLACFLEAAAAVDKKRIIVIGAVDEEGDSKGARNLLGKFKPKHIIVGEPSGWSNLNIGYKGSINLFYSHVQRKEHSSNSNPNCQERAVMFFNELSNYCQKFNIGRTLFKQLGIKLIAINSEDDGLNERVKMRINIRAPIGFEIEDLKKFAEEKKNKAIVDYSEFEEPVLVDKQNKVISAFIRSIRALGGEVRFKLKTGTSDMNILQKYKVPLVTYGPGDSSLEHTPDECLDLDEYEKAVKILSLVLKNL